MQWGQFTAVPVVLARISACKVIRIGLRHEGHSMTWDSGINMDNVFSDQMLRSVFRVVERRGARMRGIGRSLSPVRA